MPQWTTDILARMRAGHTTEADLQKLGASSTGDPILDYNGFMFERFGLHAAHSSYPLATSFDRASPYALAAASALSDIALDLASHLLDRLDAEGVDGALVEFGVFRGAWLGHMLNRMDQKRRWRPTFGFDSFEGLPAPDPATDSEGWHAGQYAAQLADVAAALRLDARPHLRLIKGWFSDTLAQTDNDIAPIAFARIDCDLYRPAVECLAYLSHRLAHGAALMFDDWTHLAHAGETRAFMEWAPTVPHLRIEAIGFVAEKMFFRVWAA
jgi:hypothetical protein